MQAKHFKDLPMEYHQKDHEHLSKTMLSVFADCPRRFKHEFVDGNHEPKVSDALTRGSALHTVALEPHLFDDTYMVFEGDRRTKQGKADYAAALESGKEILNRADFDRIIGMGKALTAHPVAKALLDTDGYVESSIFWEQDGLGFKCRPDLMRNDGLIVDIKTCKTANPHRFKYDARNYRYPLSVALTTAGYKALYGKDPEDYILLCIEPEPPYIISCFSTFQAAGVEPSVLEVGQDQLERLILEYKHCLENNDWPEYQLGIQPLEAV